MVKDRTARTNKTVKLNFDKILDTANHKSASNNIDIKEQNEILLSLLDTSDDILLILNEKGEVKYINQSGCQLLGFNYNEVINKNWSDNFVAKRFREKIRKHITASFSENYEDSEAIENPIITKNGCETIVRWKNTYIKDFSNQTVFVASAGRELNPKEYEVKLQKVIAKILDASNSLDNLRDFLKFVHTQISELMPVDNFYIALINEEQKLINFPYFVDGVDLKVSSQKIGQGLTEYVYKTGKSALINKKLNNKLISNGEIKLTGTQAAIWLGIPLKIQEKTIGVLVVQDYFNELAYGKKEKEILELISKPISRAIKRKKDETEKNELLNKLKELNSSKDNLFSLISHDLRSPFNSLLGFSEILNSEYETLTNEEKKEYLKIIHEASKNLYNMTNNLLQFSRFQTGKIDFKPERFELQKVVNKCSDSLKGNIVKKQLNFSFDISNDSVVFADKDMVCSIVQNLLSNAIKFTNRGGTIRISSRKVIKTHGSNIIEISIQDSGVGMTKDVSNKLFKEDLYSSPGTEKEQGTGLGLLLVKDFVEKNDGNIIVKTALDKGTTFIISLPASH